jgi:PAT family beta-lactamase induction signal transducer AmpG
MHEPAPMTRPRLAWLWVIGGFLFQALPAAIRDEALPIALKNIHVSDTRITQVVAILGLAVAVKILWAPLMPLTGPTRRFVLIAQACILLALVGLAVLVGQAAQSTLLILGVLTLISVLSAGHDFALDGYYVSSLDDHGRAQHSGLLSFASKTGQVIAGPGLIWWAGHQMNQSVTANSAWQAALLLASGVGVLAWTANQFAFRREPPVAASAATLEQRLSAMLSSLWQMLGDARFPALLGLIFFYRASEIHMAKVLPLFAVATADTGGLALGNETYALLRIPTAILGLALGGLFGSFVVTRWGLSRSLLPLGLLMHMPLIGIAWLAAHPQASLTTISALFFIEYFAYGAGVCALLLAMMKMAAGAEAATRYALLSTIALVASYLPGLWAGALAQEWGYAHYFLFALALAVPGLLAAYWGRRAFAEA